MEESINLEELVGDDESADEVKEENDEKEETEKEKAQKRAKKSPLHEHYVAPLSFLLDAANSDHSFNITSTRRPFGDNLEAYVRPCYETILQLILDNRKECRDKRSAQGLPKRSTLFVIRGSSGIGKSTFLAYFMGRARSDKRFSNFAVFYASKASRGPEGEPRVSEVRCHVMLDGETVIDGEYANVANDLKKHLPKMGLIIMDGCSMPCDLTGFKGTLIVAGSPSLYVKNLIDAIYDHFMVTMPALLADEAREIADIIGVDKAVVENNWSHMEGITRYMFEPGAAKRKVEEAVKEVNASSITKMVSMQASNRGENRIMVHSLVLWKMGTTYMADPSFELVSRFAEKLVAKKLCLEAAAKLKSARQDMAPLSGAEGYAGALFEAYAIRTIQEGCTLSLRSLDDGTVKQVSVPAIGAEPVVVESNDLTASIVPYDSVRVAGTGIAQFLARLLWPTTTNFPTFDCFYFHTTGEVFLLQMTIAKVHDLKNSGASKAKRYFDRMLGANKPSKYPAVFVVPAEMAAAYSKQKFTGLVNKQTVNFGPHFEQWVIGI